MVDLTQKPFYLKEEQILKINAIIDEMSIEEKIGQLFFNVGLSTQQEALDLLLAKNPGGIMFRPQGKEDIKKAHRYLQANSKIPLLLAANIEAGADGLFFEGTKTGNNMLVAATGDDRNAYNQGYISMSEARSVGGNVAFAPVVDINFNFENPITNTRSYGDDYKVVARMSKAFTRGVQDAGGSVMIKHFPGDGTDGRDQHLVKTANSLNFKSWLKTYGNVYQQNIDDGALGMMAGHIALPSYFEENNIREEDKNTPASLSYNLLTNLARKQLGFNGLIMTDATLMAGFGSFGKREELVPRAIAAGNDMFLFTKSIDEDFEFMLSGYKKGIITEQRLADALLRILGLKFKLELNDYNTHFSTFDEAQLQNNKSTAYAIAEMGITLVKDDQGLLPLTVNKKIGLLNFTQTDFHGNTPVYDNFKSNLQQNGFQVVDLDFGVGFDNMNEFIKLSAMTIKELKQQADVIIYVTEYLPASNKTSIRINYRSFAGFDAPWFINDIPTMYVSFGSPYHGYDFADIKTGINSYYNSLPTVQATVEKIVSNNFKGISPVNLDFTPFNGSIHEV